MNIYVSTTAFKSLSLEEIIEFAENESLNLEFSSNLPYHPKSYSLVKKTKIQRITHNYFPAPETPFVLNLASLDKQIRKKSIQHCIKALEFARQISAPFYAAHAGYCLDPKPNELGKKLKNTMVRSRDKYWEVFLESIWKIEKIARQLRVPFLIENNVLTEENLYLNGNVNPLLCCDPIEINQLFNELQSEYVGLLLDTAHLKVSSNTLEFDLRKAVCLISSFVKAIHHSDNDGKNDTNKPIKKKYWFKEFMYSFRKVPQVLEVKNQSLSAINKQQTILKKFVDY